MVVAAHDDGGRIHHVQLVREHLIEAEALRLTRPVVPVEVVVEYIVSALMGLLTWWLDNDLPYAAEEMARMFQRLTRPALESALRAAPGDRRP